MNAFEPTVVVEHEAVIGGFKCLYWLIKNELAHHTNYPKLLSLAELLGCDYFRKLKVKVIKIFKIKSVFTLINKNYKTNVLFFLMSRLTSAITTDLIALSMKCWRSWERLLRNQSSLKSNLQRQLPWRLMKVQTSPQPGSSMCMSGMEVEFHQNLTYPGSYMWILTTLLFLRYLDKEGHVFNQFLDLVELADGKAHTIVTAIKTAICKKGLPTERLYGVGTDGAAVMTGIIIHIM